jgi:hypothetical protein
MLSSEKVNLCTIFENIFSRIKIVTLSHLNYKLNYTNNFKKNGDESSYTPNTTFSIFSSTVTLKNCKKFQTKFQT